MIQSVAALRAFERTEYCYRNCLVSGFSQRVLVLLNMSPTLGNTLLDFFLSIIKQECSLMESECSLMESEYPSIKSDWRVQ